MLVNIMKGGINNMNKDFDTLEEFFLNNEELNDELLFELDSIHCKLDILAKMIVLSNLDEKIKLYKQYFV